jgi:triacylglycerol esterase/lipase EstA (alpha/beta hydrolase family)
MELSGTLFSYSRSLTAFESGPAEYTKTVVFVGGLGDAYNAVKYLVPLQKRLQDLGWTLTQVGLSSSGNGYGISSLIQDSSELDELVIYLKTRRNKEKVVFLGHSTGKRRERQKRKRVNLL